MSNTSDNRQVEMDIRIDRIKKVYPEISKETIINILFDYDHNLRSGSFLQAVKDNNLDKASIRADLKNLKALGFIALLIHRDKFLLEISNEYSQTEIDLLGK